MVHGSPNAQRGTSFVLPTGSASPPRDGSLPPSSPVHESVTLTAPYDRPTVKRLFCLSGNRVPIQRPRRLVDDTGTVLGHLCHIKSRRENGPRWDALQSDWQRHSFENLILLCGPCHDRIDDPRNLPLFPVETLLSYKRAHEEKQTIETAATDTIVDGLLAGLSVAINVHAAQLYTVKLSAKLVL